MAPSLGGNESKYLDEVIRSTWIGGAGSYGDKVEHEWAEICGVKRVCDNFKWDYCFAPCSFRPWGGPLEMRLLFRH